MARRNSPPIIPVASSQRRRTQMQMQTNNRRCDSHSFCPDITHPVTVTRCCASCIAALWHRMGARSRPSRVLPKGSYPASLGYWSRAALATSSSRRTRQEGGTGPAIQRNAPRRTQCAEFHTYRTYHSFQHISVNVQASLSLFFFFRSAQCPHTTRCVWTSHFLIPFPNVADSRDDG